MAERQYLSNKEIEKLLKISIRAITATPKVLK
jgi:hypothetical protein